MESDIIIFRKETSGGVAKSQLFSQAKPAVNPHIRLESSKGSLSLSLSGIWRMKTLFIVLIPVPKYKFVYCLKSNPGIAWEIFA